MTLPPDELLDAEIEMREHAALAMIFGNTLFALGRESEARALWERADRIYGVAPVC